MTAPDTEFPSKFSDLQWGEPKAYNQLSVVSPRTTDGGGYISYSNVTISLGDLYYITDGLADYLESHEHKELDVPGTYSDFDSFPGFVSEVTARGRNGAKGLTQYKLEDAVRFAAGKGRFRSGDLTVYGVKNALSIVQYDGDAFAVKNADLAMPDNPVTTEINGIDIPEENSALISGIRRLMNVLETQFEAAVTGYKRPSNHGHVFETETGTDVTVHQSTLRQLSSCSESADDVLRKCDEKASPFTAGMNPTYLTQSTLVALNRCFKWIRSVMTRNRGGLPALSIGQYRNPPIPRRKHPFLLVELGVR
jgi:hypothetical protein